MVKLSNRVRTRINSDRIVASLNYDPVAIAVGSDTGSVIVNVVPSPGFDFTAIVP